MSTLTTHTTAIRSAHSTGLCKFNTDTKAIEVSDGTNWSIYDYDSGTVSPVTNTLAVDFDGATDYLDFGNNTALMPTAFTISFWMKQDDTGINTVVQKNTLTSNGYQVYFNNGDFLYAGDGVKTFATSLLTSTSAWYHVAVTHDGSSLKGYVDGSLISTFSSTITSSTANLTLGRHSSGSAFYHHGKVDEFSLHNSALDAPNIAQIYNNSNPINLTINQGNYNGSSSLVGYWRMGDGTGDTDNGSGSPTTGDVVGSIVNQAAAHSNGSVGGGSPEYLNDAP